MKKLIVLITLLVSQLSFAQTLPVEEGAQVIRAMTESFTQNDLSCINLIDNKSHKASSLNWAIFEKASVTITENQQPVITIYKKLEGDFDIVAKITTDETFTIVVKMKIETAKLSKQTRNVGTIIRPRYEDVITRTLTENFECK